MNITFSVETITEKLFEAIEAKDKQKTLLLIVQLKEAVKTDPAACKWVTEPLNLKEVHNSLIENLNVDPKAMRVKERITHRQRRALLFVQAIENGIRRS